MFFSTQNVEHPLAPAHEVDANRAETPADRRAASKPLRAKKNAIEKPYHEQIVDREVAKLPDYMQVAWRTPPDQRTEGQRLNVVQIERHARARLAPQARSRKSTSSR